MNAEQCLVGRRAWLGLGSNLGDRQAHLSAALEGLRRCSDVTLVAVSRFYETVPVGPVAQGPFLNAVASLETCLDPEALLHICHSLEAERGRVRRERWGPRTLDVDILDIEGVVVNLPHLTEPHPEAHRRAFVLLPWCDLAPDYFLQGKRLTEWLSGLSS